MKHLNIMNVKGSYQKERVPKYMIIISNIKTVLIILNHMFMNDTFQMVPI